MLTLWEKFVFGFVILATAAAFLQPLIRRYRIVRAGRPEPRFDEVWRRVREALAKVLLQRCTLKNERLFTGLMHVFIFYSALTFDTMTVNHTLEGFFDGFYLFGKTSFGLFVSLLVDVFAVLVLIGVLFFAVRRFIVRPKAYATTPEGLGRDLYVHRPRHVELPLFRDRRPSPSTRRPPASPSWASGWAVSSWEVWTRRRLSAHFKVSWWLHILLVFGFIAYVPHSKYLHMFTGPLNVLFRRHAPSGELGAHRPRELGDFRPGQGDGPLLEGFPGRFRLHGMRPVPGRLPGLRQRQTPLPEDDPRQSRKASPCERRQGRREKGR